VAEWTETQEPEVSTLVREERGVLSVCGTPSMYWISLVLSLFGFTGGFNSQDRAEQRFYKSLWLYVWVSWAVPTSH
jgi:hypothetical protein